MKQLNLARRFLGMLLILVFGVGQVSPAGVGAEPSRSTLRGNQIQQAGMEELEQALGVNGEAGGVFVKERNNRVVVVVTGHWRSDVGKAVNDFRKQKKDVTVVLLGSDRDTLDLSHLAEVAGMIPPEMKSLQVGTSGDYVWTARTASGGNGTLTVVTPLADPNSFYLEFTDNSDTLGHLQDPELLSSTVVRQALGEREFALAGRPTDEILLASIDGSARDVLQQRRQELRNRPEEKPTVIPTFVSRAGSVDRRTLLGVVGATLFGFSLGWLGLPTAPPPVQQKADTIVQEPASPAIAALPAKTEPMAPAVTPAVLSPARAEPAGFAGVSEDVLVRVRPTASHVGSTPLPFSEVSSAKLYSDAGSSGFPLPERKAATPKPLVQKPFAPTYNLKHRVEGDQNLNRYVVDEIAPELVPADLRFYNVDGSHVGQFAVDGERSQGGRDWLRVRIEPQRDTVVARETGDPWLLVAGEIAQLEVQRTQSGVRVGVKYWNERSRTWEEGHRPRQQAAAIPTRPSSVATSAGSGPPPPPKVGAQAPQAAPVGGWKPFPTIEFFNNPAATPLKGYVERLQKLSDGRKTDKLSQEEARKQLDNIMRDANAFFQSKEYRAYLTGVRGFARALDREAEDRRINERFQETLQTVRAEVLGLAVAGGPPPAVVLNGKIQPASLERSRPPIDPMAAFMTDFKRSGADLNGVAVNLSPDARWSTMSRVDSKGNRYVDIVLLNKAPLEITTPDGKTASLKQGQRVTVLAQKEHKRTFEIVGGPQQVLTVAKGPGAGSPPPPPPPLISKSPLSNTAATESNGDLAHLTKYLQSAGADLSGVTLQAGEAGTSWTAWNSFDSEKNEYVSVALEAGSVKVKMPDGKAFSVKTGQRVEVLVKKGDKATFQVTQQAQVQPLREVKGALAPLVQELGPDKRVNLTVWKVSQNPDFYRDIALAGVNELGIDVKFFVELPSQQQQRVLDMMNQFGFKGVVFVGGEADWFVKRVVGGKTVWVSPKEDGIRRLYTSLSGALEKLKLGNMEIGFVLDYEPYTAPDATGWDRQAPDFTGSMELAKLIRPLIEPFARKNPDHVKGPLLRFFQPHWAVNGKRDDGINVQGIRDDPDSISIMFMTYANKTPTLMDWLQKGVFKRLAQEPRLEFYLGAETLSKKKLDPKEAEIVTFDGQLEKLPGVLLDAVKGLDPKQKQNLAGVFIHTVNDPEEAHKIVRKFLEASATPPSSGAKPNGAGAGPPPPPSDGGHKMVIQNGSTTTTATFSEAEVRKSTERNAAAAPVVSPPPANWVPPPGFSQVQLGVDFSKKLLEEVSSRLKKSPGSVDRVTFPVFKVAVAGAYKLESVPTPRGIGVQATFISTQSVLVRVNQELYLGKTLTVNWGPAGTVSLPSPGNGVTRVDAVVSGVHALEQLALMEGSKNFGRYDLRNSPDRNRRFAVRVLRGMRLGSGATVTAIPLDGDFELVQNPDLGGSQTLVGLTTGQVSDAFSEQLRKLNGLRKEVTSIRQGESFQLEVPGNGKSVRVLIPEQTSRTVSVSVAPMPAGYIEPPRLWFPGSEGRTISPTFTLEVTPNGSSQLVANLPANHDSSAVFEWYGKSWVFAGAPLQLTVRPNRFGMVVKVAPSEGVRPLQTVVGPTSRRLAPTSSTEFDPNQWYPRDAEGERINWDPDIEVTRNPATGLSTIRMDESPQGGPLEGTYVPTKEGPGAIVRFDKDAGWVVVGEVDAFGHIVAPQRGLQGIAPEMLDVVARLQGFPIPGGTPKTLAQFLTSLGHKIENGDPVIGGFQISFDDEDGVKADVQKLPSGEVQVALIPAHPEGQIELTDVSSGDDEEYSIALRPGEPLLLSIHPGGKRDGGVVIHEEQLKNLLGAHPAPDGFKWVNRPNRHKMVIQEGPTQNPRVVQFDGKSYAVLEGVVTAQKFSEALSSLMPSALARDQRPSVRWAEGEKILVRFRILGQSDKRNRNTRLEVSLEAPEKGMLLGIGNRPAQLKKARVVLLLDENAPTKVFEGIAGMHTISVSNGATERGVELYSDGTKQSSFGPAPLIRPEAAGLKRIVEEWERLGGLAGIPKKLIDRGSRGFSWMMQFFAQSGGGNPEEFLEWLRYEEEMDKWVGAELFRLQVGMPSDPVGAHQVQAYMEEIRLLQAFSAQMASKAMNSLDSIPKRDREQITQTLADRYLEIQQRRLDRDKGVLSKGNVPPEIKEAEWQGIAALRQENAVRSGTPEQRVQGAVNFNGAMKKLFQAHERRLQSAAAGDSSPSSLANRQLRLLGFQKATNVCRENLGMRWFWPNLAGSTPDLVDHFEWLLPAVEPGFAREPSVSDLNKLGEALKAAQVRQVQFEFNDRIEETNRQLAQAEAERAVREQERKRQREKIEQENVVPSERQKMLEAQAQEMEKRVMGLGRSWRESLEPLRDVLWELWKIHQELAEEKAELKAAEAWDRIVNKGEREISQAEKQVLEIEKRLLTASESDRPALETLREQWLRYVSRLKADFGKERFEAMRDWYKNPAHVIQNPVTDRLLAVARRLEKLYGDAMGGNGQPIPVPETLDWLLRNVRDLRGLQRHLDERSRLKVDFVKSAQLNLMWTLYHQARLETMAYPEMERLGLPVTRLSEFSLDKAPGVFQVPESVRKLPLGDVRFVGKNKTGLALTGGAEPPKIWLNSPKRVALKSQPVRTVLNRETGRYVLAEQIAAMEVPSLPGMKGSVTLYVVQSPFPPLVSQRKNQSGFYSVVGLTEGHSIVPQPGFLEQAWLPDQVGKPKYAPVYFILNRIKPGDDGLPEEIPAVLIQTIDFDKRVEFVQALGLSTGPVFPKMELTADGQKRYEGLVLQNGDSLKFRFGDPSLWNSRIKNYITYTLEVKKVEDSNHPRGWRWAWDLVPTFTYEDTGPKSAKGGLEEVSEWVGQVSERTSAVGIGPVGPEEIAAVSGQLKRIAASAGLEEASIDVAMQAARVRQQLRGNLLNVALEEIQAGRSAGSWIPDKGVLPQVLILRGSASLLAPQVAQLGVLPVVAVAETQSAASGLEEILNRLNVRTPYLILSADLYSSGEINSRIQKRFPPADYSYRDIADSGLEEIRKTLERYGIFLGDINAGMEKVRDYLASQG